MRGYLRRLQRQPERVRAFFQAPTTRCAARSLYLGVSIATDGVLYPKPPALIQVEQEQQERDRDDGFERCRAAIQFSPADPPRP
ncbi:hypothetical protein [Benzoatithermus flavus]|uniref:Uncharacterized protein n=1 Tax=Benzoatithermus flavus TaxID=3108223 RepID=A0ABU8XWR5_9PROT